MQERRLPSYDGLHEIARRTQTQFQTNNFSVVLYRVTTAMPDLPCETLLLVEEAADNTVFALDAAETETALRDPVEFLRSCAAEWADNCDDPRIERYQWRLRDPEDDAVDAAYAQPCVIVVKGCYFGYTPYAYVHDQHGDPLHFACAAAAQAWIADRERQTYHLSHNEQGRPSYTIVPI